MALRIAHDVNSRRLENEPTIHLTTRLVHGYRRAVRIAGDGGAPLLLIHGIGDSSRTWEQIIPLLAREHLVVAPDLLGHGASDKPRAAYSVAAYANGMRDLLAVLGIDKVTLVGHSLGGAVALLAQAERMQAVLDLASEDPVGGAFDRLGMNARGAVLRSLRTAVRRA